MLALSDPRDRRFWLWAAGGLPFAFLVLVLWPPVLAAAALALLVLPPGSAPERLGLVQSVAAVAVLVGVLNLGGGLDPLPWLAGGALLSLLGALRYRAATR